MSDEERTRGEDGVNEGVEPNEAVADFSNILICLEELDDMLRKTNSTLQHHKIHDKIAKQLHQTNDPVLRNKEGFLHKLMDKEES
jgi:hypothetical protein